MDRKKTSGKVMRTSSFWMRRSALIGLFCCVKQIFILSPARSSGPRASLIQNPRAGFELAQRLQKGGAATIGEVFSFLSGLYFRGKLTYARTFAAPPRGLPGIWVITSNRGLLPVDEPLTLSDLVAFGEAEIDAGNDAYSGPLLRDAHTLHKSARGRAAIVFLGSVSSKKYVDLLLQAFRETLVFPPAFLGRGDMSRGGLLLRHASAKEELPYVPLLNSPRKGSRPTRLEPRKWGFKIVSGETPLPEK
jgi:hypothetical protein